jgi:hypothetical protein
MQGSLCGHTQEKCPNYKGNHIAFSSRCALKTEAMTEERDWRRREPAGQTSKTMGPTSGVNRTALGLRVRALGGGEMSGCEGEMADAEEGGAEGEAEDVTMVEGTTLTATTTATPASSTKGIAMAPGAGIEPQNGT